MWSPGALSVNSAAVRAVFEYVKSCGLDTKFVVNIQGDMPAIDTSGLRRLLERMERVAEVGIGTLARKCVSLAEFNDRNRVKTVLDRDLRALYFSRLPIPSGANAADAGAYWDLRFSP